MNIVPDNSALEYDRREFIGRVLKTGTSATAFNLMLQAFPFIGVMLFGNGTESEEIISDEDMRDYSFTTDQRETIQTRYENSKILVEELRNVIAPFLVAGFASWLGGIGILKHDKWGEIIVEKLGPFLPAKTDKEIAFLSAFVAFLIGEVLGIGSALDFQGSLAHDLTNHLVEDLGVSTEQREFIAKKIGGILYKNRHIQFISSTAAALPFGHVGVNLSENLRRKELGSLHTTEAL